MPAIERYDNETPPDGAGSDSDTRKVKKLLKEFCSVRSALATVILRAMGRSLVVRYVYAHIRLTIRNRSLPQAPQLLHLG
ncbi:MAG: hypothetical protein H7Z10_02530 [Gemmatimonadaceae bacterium]|nr:hypothetical protein [Acetobacteraceae bacterium]